MLDYEAHLVESKVPSLLQLEVSISKTLYNEYKRR